ncbi:hypothetical protein BOTNAR_0123g00080 [Botryotinia narcissicola]|uniref:Calcineurin-like phosphoesterase domain-containing protein n=1 Tax=Botryotinia narcissicola TaxID=278944 RepID=A0A4Z1IY82_9HELO|nr:hypothetical protein BOTNAR_0123g00080 [Botryotinia narcissicola]
MPIELDILRGIRTLAAAIGTSAILLFVFTVIINIIAMFPKRVNPDKRKTRPWEPTPAVKVDELPEAGQEIVNQSRPKRFKRHETNEGFVLDYNRDRQNAQRYRGRGKAFTGDGEIGRRQLEPLSRLRPTPLSLWSDKNKPPQHPPPGGPSGYPPAPPAPPGPGAGGGITPAPPATPPAPPAPPPAPPAPPASSAPSGIPGPGAGGVIAPAPPVPPPAPPPAPPVLPAPSAPSGSGPGWGVGIRSAPPVTSGITSSGSTIPDSIGLPQTPISPNIDFWIPWKAGNTEWAKELARQRQHDVGISANELLKSFIVLKQPIFYQKFSQQFMSDPAHKDELSGDTGHPHWFFENMKLEQVGRHPKPFSGYSQEKIDRDRFERTSKEGQEALIYRARKSLEYAQELLNLRIKPPGKTSLPAPPKTTTSTTGIGVTTTRPSGIEALLASFRPSSSAAPNPPPVGSTSWNTTTGSFPSQDEEAVAEYIRRMASGLITGSSSQADPKTTIAPFSFNPFAAAPRPHQTSLPTVSAPVAPATSGRGHFGGTEDKIGLLIHSRIDPYTDVTTAAEVRRAFGQPNDLVVLPPTIKQNFSFHYVSDLHLEQTSYTNFDFQPRAQYLILAGDIGNTGGAKSETEYRNFLARMCVKPQLKRVFLVAGNRDFWPSNSCTVEGTIKMLRGFAKHPDTLGKLVFLEKDRYTIQGRGGKLVILGCTLWTEKRRGGGHEPRDQNNQQRTERNFASCEWIRKETKKIRDDPKEAETRILIITHMPPSKSGTSPPEQTAKKLRDFSSGDSHGSDVIDGCKGHGYDHSTLQTTMPLLDWRDVWIWGHTHWNEPRHGKKRHGGMRFESNQRGNASGNPLNYHPKPPGTFKPQKIIWV